ncbi:MAG: hypothetical protein JWM95_2716 [Gemmatimonadetes bacterium]|nr:hypothetical protein [Gemmatimonadota bacterium]
MRPYTSLRPYPFAFVVLLLCLVPGTSRGQIAFDSPKGRVEVLGLRRWTIHMLQDSIRHYVHGQELYDAACMVTLRDSLHFVEASVDHFNMSPPGALSRSFLTIKVVEPGQASTVQWDERPRNQFTSVLPDYAPLVLSITDSTGAVWRGRMLHWLQFADSAARSAALSRAPAAAQEDANRVFAFLRSRQSDADRARAMRTLKRDGLWVNRMVAVSVLSNFPSRDSTWWTLVSALRDPHEAVREAAASVLMSLPARPIDWRVSTRDLRLLLGGTNLPAIQTVFALLANTSVAPALAQPLLRENSEWILDHVAAETPMAGDAAHRLLVRLNDGRDLGRTRSAWAAWTSAL